MSDERNCTAGPTTGQSGPEPNPMRQCMTGIQMECLLPIATEYMGMDSEAIVQKVLNTDLRETCGPVLDAQGCASRVLQSPVCSNVLQQNSPMINNLRKGISAANTTVNFICRENVEVFDEHKACLFRINGNTPAIAQTIESQCNSNATPDASICPPPGAVDCAVNVIQEQCGQEIASAIRRLSSRLLADMNCTKRKRSYLTKAKKVMKKEYFPLKLMKESFHLLF